MAAGNEIRQLRSGGAAAVIFDFYIVSALLSNNCTIRRCGEGWTIEDAGQRSVCGGRWLDRLEAMKRGIEFAADIFPTFDVAVREALLTRD
jgi:hypothetical protein